MLIGPETRITSGLGKPSNFGSPCGVSKQASLSMVDAIGVKPVQVFFSILYDAQYRPTAIGVVKPAIGNIATTTATRKYLLELMAGIRASGLCGEPNMLTLFRDCFSNGLHDTSIFQTQRRHAISAVAIQVTIRIWILFYWYETHEGYLSASYTALPTRVMLAQLFFSFLALASRNGHA